MSGSITSSVCALCRRPLPPDDTAGSATRLCDNCRKLVDNIRPATTRPTVTPAGNATPHQAEHLSDVNPSPQQPSNLGFETAQLNPQPSPNPSIPAGPAEPAWAEAPAPESQASPVWAASPRQEAPAKPTRPDPGRSDSGSRPQSAPNHPLPQQPTQNGRGYTPRREPPASPSWSDVVMVPSGADSREAPFQSTTEESAYHQNWPIMVEEGPAKKRGRGILILVLLVVAGLSAVVGFVVFKDRFFGPRGGPATGAVAGSPNRAPVAQDPKLPEPRNAQATASPAENARPASAQSPEPARPPAASGDAGKPQPTAQASQPPQTTTPATAVTAQTTQAQGGSAQASGAKMTSLQAASFPSESSAKQFQDKLVKAGLPAYVVAADIPHRGRWFRVRAGRFASQEEAHKAAESFRKQAAAAGINLQLVPCDYQ